MMEVVISIAIIAIITAIVLVNYNRFGSNVAGENFVRSVAASIRAAHIYTFATREFKPGTDLYPAYGVHFNRDEPNQYILFADCDNDGGYDDTSATCGGSNEFVTSFPLEANFRIQAVCRGDDLLALTCGPALPALTFVSIVFRKTGGAAIKGHPPGPPSAEYAYGQIRLISRHGITRTIEMWSSGGVRVR